VAKPEKVLFNQVPIAPMPAIAATEVKMANGAACVGLSVEPGMPHADFSAEMRTAP
jgi:hypothetical protein